MDYLRRYQAGECEQVWSELLAHGGRIREDPLFSEALAVARETMRRVRSNIEVLIPRLTAIGYQFGYGWVQPFVHERLISPYRTFSASRKIIVTQPPLPERFTYEYRTAYMEMLEMAKSQPPLFLPATDAEEHIAHLEQSILACEDQSSAYAASLRTIQDTYKAKPEPVDLINQLEQMLGTLPISVRAWFEIVGGVNFVGFHPEWRTLLPDTATIIPLNEYDYLCPFYVLDPIFILPLDEEMIAHYRRWLKADVETHYLTLSVDDAAKYLDGQRERYNIELPNAAIDAIFDGYGKPFVSYLRECFRWGGFPGWSTLARYPEQDIHFLTKDLLPI